MIHPALLLAMIVFVTAGAGCYQKNTAYDPDAQACSGGDECGEDLCVGGVCVQCTLEDTSRCTEDTPICSGAGKCLPCTAHEQCNGGPAPSGVCTPSGACAAVADVAYVSASGTDNDACTAIAPCTKVSKALAANRPFVFFRTGTVMENVSVDGKTVAFLAAPDAKLKGASTGAVIEAKSASKLTVVDLEITEGLGSAGHGILSNGSSTLELRRAKLSKNSGIGVLSSGGNIKVSQSTFMENTGGGLSVEGSIFEIVNNIFFRNGGMTSNLGGVSFSGISSPGNRFEFNTVTSNQGASGAIGGVQCLVINMPLQLENSIVYGNIQSGVTNPDQVSISANCAWRYSLIGPKAFPGGIEILNEDPQFQSAEDFNLKPTSPARDAANPTATLTIDFFGKPRPAGGRSDMGAIEVQQ